MLEFDERPDLARGNGVWDLGSAEAAEMAKLAETTYRDVNIGLANQFARFAGAHGIDVMQVIEASNSQPYSHIHSPGIAVGGHCIPVYPRLYLWNDPDATVVRAAREANAGMPSYTVGLLEGAHGDLDRADASRPRRGLPRRGQGDGVLRRLRRRSRRCRPRARTSLVHDPLYSDEELAGPRLRAVPPRRQGGRRGRPGRPRRLPVADPGGRPRRPDPGRRPPGHRRRAGSGRA